MPGPAVDSILGQTTNMSEMQVSQPRALLPRRLDQQETLNSLNQWVITFKNFYRRCTYYGYFLQPGVAWSTNSNERGFTAEQTGLKRSPSVLSSDLEGSLQTLSGYLPFDYVASKLCNETTDMKSVWQVIYEIYDLEITTTNFLDYATMTKNQDESYRGFYNRLVGFVRQHLPQITYEADGVRSPATGEQLSISLLDAITIHWLLMIDKRLIAIVKTELATDLKTKRMCQLIKQIAPNVDEWLQRYVQADTVSMIHSQQATPTLPATTDSPITAIVQRIEKLEMGARSRPPRGRFRPQRGFRPPSTCGHCAYINKQLGASLDVRHNSQSCQRKQLSINVLEMEEPDDGYQFDDNDISEGEVEYYQNSSSQQYLQNSSAENFPAKPTSDDTRPVYNSSLLDKQVNLVNTFSDNFSENNCHNTVSNLLQSSAIYTTRNSAPSEANLQDRLSANLFKLNQSTYSWGTVQKSRSPRLPISLNNVPAYALLDSGAELNVLDAQLAHKAEIKIIPTLVTAKAANKQTLDVQGQSAEEVKLSCTTEEGSKMLNLGFVLIVHGLGVSCIVGQPRIILSTFRKRRLLFSQQRIPFIKSHGTKMQQIIP